MSTLDAANASRHDRPSIECIQHISMRSMLPFNPLYIPGTLLHHETQTKGVHTDRDPLQLFPVLTRPSLRRMYIRISPSSVDLAYPSPLPFSSRIFFSPSRTYSPQTFTNIADIALLGLLQLPLLPSRAAHSRLPLTLPWILTLSPDTATLSGISLYSRISRPCSRIPTPPFPYIPNWSPTPSAGSLLTLSQLFVHIDPACYRCMLILFTVLTYA